MSSIHPRLGLSVYLGSGICPFTVFYKKKVFPRTKLYVTSPRVKHAFLEQITLPPV